MKIVKRKHKNSKLCYVISDWLDFMLHVILLITEFTEMRFLPYFLKITKTIV